MIDKQESKPLPPEDIAELMAWCERLLKIQEETEAECVAYSKRVQELSEKVNPLKADWSWGPVHWSKCPLVDRSLFRFATFGPDTVLGPFDRKCWCGAQQ